MKDHLLFRMLEFGAKRNGKFAQHELAQHLGEDWDSEYFEQMSGKEPSPTNFFLPKVYIEPDQVPEVLNSLELDDNDTGIETRVIFDYILSPIGMATYIEMLELHESRLTAQQARTMSAAAIEIALGIGLVQVFLAFLALALR